MHNNKENGILKKKAENKKWSQDAARNNRQRRRGRIGTATALLIIILAAAGAMLSLTVFFKVENVRVEGIDRNYSEEEILRAGDIQLGSSLILLSTKDIEEKLTATLPLISSVSVKREFPDTVVIDVRTSDYRMALCYDEGYLIVSENLKIIDNVTTVDESKRPYTCIWGINPSSTSVGATLSTGDENGTYYLESMIDSLKSHDILAMASDINVSDKLNLSLVYDERIYVMIGTASNLDYKISMLKEIAVEKLTDDETGYLDLSVAGKGTFKSGDMQLPDDYRKTASIK